MGEIDAVEKTTKPKPKANKTRLAPGQKGTVVLYILSYPISHVLYIVLRLAHVYTFTREIYETSSFEYNKLIELDLFIIRRYDMAQFL